jgi:hypothetical protein
MSSAAPKTVTEQPTPAPSGPTDAPAAVETPRDLMAEKQQEQAREKADASKKAPAFTARRNVIPPVSKNPEPEYETLLFAPAANNPLADLNDRRNSTFIPFFGAAFYLLNFMDVTMASTKRFTDNSMGWTPPLSQMYISLLLFVQICRAMDAAGSLPPASDLSNFLITFEREFPMSGLWIPGPLVALFRNVSAFWPSSDDFFGNVTPTLPAHPGWTTRNAFNLGAYNGVSFIRACLPNISYFISRMRTICNKATAPNMTQALFSNSVDGPNYVSSLFHTVVANTAAENWLLVSPGGSEAYPDNLQLWQNGAAALNRLAIPPNLNRTATNPTVPTNEWTAYFRLSQTPNEHVWFAPASAVMALYSKFFHGSQTMDNVQPNCSAAPAIKLNIRTDSNLIVTPTFTARAGDGSSDQVGNANAEAHYALRHSAILRLDASLALKGVPDANVFASLTYAINAVESPASAAAHRQGPFWSLAPNVQSRDNVETLPGVLSIILRDYHSPIALK